ncbi:hypothetical protein AS9A_1429 [Hoyosella subflava DQS3-9A1]|uniref:Uncharacterized protein n=1 Tax=Hoyosella subflava (strain DSM 45089 / JCM 17490 / NBRC 109087 / DQS3-9A1) TaxID=443218 RepID=F6EH44_HOYSD|nr:hypothetical protein AS9A_1429 [Hoyosella subflava DQS3-9A1]
MPYLEHGYQDFVNGATIDNHVFDSKSKTWDGRIETPARPWQTPGNLRWCLIVRRYGHDDRDNSSAVSDGDDP